MPSWGGRYSRMSGWTLRGGLRSVRVEGIGNMLVPRGAERGKNLPTDWTGTVEGGMLAITINAEGGVRHCSPLKWTSYNSLSGSFG